jgi:hypothetical protein
MVASQVDVGTKLRFSYSDHDVWLMDDETAYRACDFSAATMLANAARGGSSGVNRNLYEAVVTVPGQLYLSCSIDGGSHCSLGQKVIIAVSAFRQLQESLAVVPATSTNDGRRHGTRILPLSEHRARAHLTLAVCAGRSAARSDD